MHIGIGLSVMSIQIAVRQYRGSWNHPNSKERCYWNDARNGKHKNVYCTIYAFQIYNLSFILSRGKLFRLFFLELLFIRVHYGTKPVKIARGTLSF